MGTINTIILKKADITQSSPAIKTIRIRALARVWPVA
jgi:hypothetical protein